MMKMVLPALLIAFALPTFAEAREVNLGTVKLSHGNDVDTLTVRSCATGNDRPGRGNRDGRLQAFRFVVTRERADIDRVDAIYGNGRRESFYPRGRSFRKNDSSNWFDLGGRDRCIRSLTVYGNTDTHSVGSLFKKARVTFYGLE